MISTEALEKLARQQQTPLFPNIVREYLQHVFLAELYKIPESENLLFKGGTALRIVYGSPRFSEDLDFSLIGVRPNKVKEFVEGLFVKSLSEIERLGIHVSIGQKSAATSGGYFGIATFKMPLYSPLEVEMNISARNTKENHGEVDVIASDFLPTYTLMHLVQSELVEEKIFGALLERKKPRDFYDLYFMMRRGMMSIGQKKRLADFSQGIITSAKKVDFKGELFTFLPADQHAIIRDFNRALESEIDRQIPQ